MWLVIVKQIAPWGLYFVPGTYTSSVFLDQILQIKVL